jgi:hypothetical protein
VIHRTNRTETVFLARQAAESARLAEEQAAQEAEQAQREAEQAALLGAFLALSPDQQAGLRLLRLAQQQGQAKAAVSIGKGVRTLQRRLTTLLADPAVRVFLRLRRPRTRPEGPGDVTDEPAYYPRRPDRRVEARQAARADRARRDDALARCIGMFDADQHAAFALLKVAKEQGTRRLSLELGKSERQTRRLLARARSDRTVAAVAALVSRRPRQSRLS